MIGKANACGLRHDELGHRDLYYGEIRPVAAILCWLHGASTLERCLVGCVLTRAE